MQKIILLASLTATLAFISACNTFKGLGQDIKKGGENLEHVAENKKQEMKEDDRRKEYNKKKQSQTQK